MIKIVPRIFRERVSVDARKTVDIAHTPHTGNLALDEQDQVRYDVPNALTQGLMAHRNFGTTGYFLGVRSHKSTRRGNRASTHQQKAREIFFRV